MCLTLDTPSSLQRVYNESLEVFKNFVLYRINLTQSNNPLKNFELAEVTGSLDTALVKLRKDWKDPEWGYWVVIYRTSILVMMVDTIYRSLSR